MASVSSPASAPAASSGADAVWMWQNGVGWAEFDAEMQARLQAAAANGTERVSFTVGATPYECDLETMTQKNQRTGFVRYVRAVRDGEVVRGFSPASVWCWAGNDGSWLPFHPDAHRALEDARRSGTQSLRIRIGRHEYEVDVERCTQQNLFHGTVRPLRPPAGVSVGTPAAAPADVAHEPVSLRPQDRRRWVNARAYELEAAGAQLATPAAVASEHLVPCDPNAVTVDHTCAVCMCGFDDDAGGVGALHAASGDAAASSSSSSPGDSDSGLAAVRLSRCTGHYFHRSCAKQALEHRPKCPICGVHYAAAIGTQPAGKLTVQRFAPGEKPLAGFPDAGTLAFRYFFPPGTQRSEHPSPGTPYTGTARVAFLPDTPRGRTILALLERAFLHRLLFRVGRSVTTGVDNTVVWAGVHHKTSTEGGEAAHGYPDDGYFGRVEGELQSLGIEPDNDLDVPFSPKPGSAMDEEDDGDNGAS